MVLAILIKKHQLFSLNNNAILLVKISILLNLHFSHKGLTHYGK